MARPYFLVSAKRASPSPSRRHRIGGLGGADLDHRRIITSKPTPIKAGTADTA